MPVERCLCCSARQAAVAAAKYFVLAYGTALGITVWWITENEGHVAVGAYILLAIYFVTFMLSIILVLSLALQRCPSVLFLWIVVICIFFLPECGLNLWVCIWTLGVHTAKGLGFLIFYAARGAVNIMCIVCVNLAYTSWKAERKAAKARISRAHAETSCFCTPPQRPYYYWNYNPQFPLFNFHRPLINGCQANYVPYSVPNLQPNCFPGPSSFQMADSPKQRPLATGLVVKHQITHGRPATRMQGAKMEAGNGDFRDQKITQKSTRTEHRPDADHAPDAGHDAVKTKELIPEPVPISTIFIVDPRQLNYKSPTSVWSNGIQAPYLDEYTQLSPSALALSTPVLHSPSFYQSAVDSVQLYPKSHTEPRRKSQQPLVTQWMGGGIALVGNWGKTMGLCEMPKNPIPPGTVFDSKGPDVEPSFGNFIMRPRRVGDLGTFRPKTLRNMEEMNEHICKQEESRPQRALIRATRNESENHHAVDTHDHDHSRHRSHYQTRHQHPQVSPERRKRLRSRDRRAKPSQPGKLRDQSRERQKDKLTTLVSSYYSRCQVISRSHGTEGSQECGGKQCHIWTCTRKVG